MILLNMGCGGGPFPGPPFVNVDFQDVEGSENYIRHDITQSWPDGFPREVDGIILSHVIEHFDCQQAVILLWRCRELLKDGGVLRLTTPDATFFRELRQVRDDQQLVQERFDPGFGCPVGYTEFALFHTEHRQIYNEELLWLHLSVAGFSIPNIRVTTYKKTSVGTEAAIQLAELDNRPDFTLFMEGIQDKSHPTLGQRWHMGYRLIFQETGFGVPIPPPETITQEELDLILG